MRTAPTIVSQANRGGNCALARDQPSPLVPEWRAVLSAPCHRPMSFPAEEDRIDSLIRRII